jgi:ribosomal protein RSM22 (predicted rRNA methylase)
MLTSTQSTRLCYSCRFDLLRLFKHGFASPSPCCRPLISNPRTCRRVNRLFSQSCLRSNETPDEQLREEPRDLGTIEKNQSLNKHLELEQAKAIATKAKKKAEHQTFIALQQEAVRLKQEAKERRTKLHEERKRQQQAEAEQRKLERQYLHEEREIQQYAEALERKRAGQEAASKAKQEAWARNVGAETFGSLKKWKTLRSRSKVPATTRAYHYKRSVSDGTVLDDTETPVIDDDDPIALLRGGGASKDEIVRMARQTFGEALPGGVLTRGEFSHYLRLYGEPARGQVQEEQLGGDKGEQSEGKNGQKSIERQEHQLLKENGEIVTLAMEEEVMEHYSHSGEESWGTAPIPKPGDIGFADETAAWQPMDTADSRIRDIAQSLRGEVYSREDNIDEPYDESGRSDGREHPLTRLGKFATSPRTVFLPQESFCKPIEKILADYSNKHLKEMCEKTFGGHGLPDSPLTPNSSSTRQRQQVPIPLDASQHMMGEMEANAYLTAVMPPTYATIMSVLTETRKRLGASWLRSLILKDGGARVLDAGAGGAGILAWNEVVKAEWASLHGSEAAEAASPPPSKAVVLTGSDTLRHRASALLENTTFVPRLPDYVHTRDLPTLDDSRPVQQRKQFDIIIAPHTLFPLREEYLRKQHVQNLWSLLSSSGGVLILLEKGIPRGFEAVAGAREYLLERYIASPGSESYESPLSDSLAQEDQITQKEKGMIIAPCTNHNKCPMYTIPGAAKGRKDFCAFQQRFIRPPFLQKVMEGGHWNDEDVNFSYLAVLKGEDLRGKKAANWEQLVDPLASPEAADGGSIPSPKELLERAFRGFENNTNSYENDHDAIKDEMARYVSEPLNAALPRVVLPPLKRKGHVTLDLCTPMGRIERWTVPKSFSKQAYRDARKSRWGDLWGLGAKTRVDRNLRCGGVGTKEGQKMERKRRRVEEREEERREMVEEERLREVEDESKGRLRGVEEDLEADEVDAVDEDEEIELRELERALEQADENGIDDDEADLLEQHEAEAEAAAATRSSHIDFRPQRKSIPTSRLLDLVSKAQKSDKVGNKAQAWSASESKVRQHLLETLNSTQHEVDVGAALKEWEEEYATDEKLTRTRDGRRRVGREKGRGRKDGSGM